MKCLGFENEFVEIYGSLERMRLGLWALGPSPSPLNKPYLFKTRDHPNFHLLSAATSYFPSQLIVCNMIFKEKKTNPGSTLHLSITHTSTSPNTPLGHPSPSTEGRPAAGGSVAWLTDKTPPSSPIKPAKSHTRLGCDSGRENRRSEVGGGWRTAARHQGSE